MTATALPAAGPKQEARSQNRILDGQSWLFSTANKIGVVQWATDLLGTRDLVF
jgi:hypothetical protein